MSTDMWPPVTAGDWPPGITSQTAYDYYLQDRSMCGCGHNGGNHGIAPDDAPYPRIGNGACYVCKCTGFEKQP